MEEKESVLAPILVVARVAGAATALLLASIWIWSWYPTFRAGREIDRQMEPMIKEAESLALDYKKVVSGGDTYIGKYVYWCVQNISEDEVFYKVDMNARLAVSNYGKMPRVTTGCADMLLNIEDVRKTPSGTGVVSVEFIYSPHPDFH